MLTEYDKSSRQRFRWFHWLKREGFNAMAITDRILAIKPGAGGSGGHDSAPTLSRKQFSKHFSSPRTQRTLAIAEEKWKKWYGEDPAEKRVG